MSDPVGPTQKGIAIADYKCGECCHSGALINFKQYLEETQMKTKSKKQHGHRRTNAKLH